MTDLVRADGPTVDRILDATHEIWHDGLERPAYGRLWQAQRATVWGGRHLARWALVRSGDVISSAKLYRFAAVLDGRSIQVAGIGAVFTPRPHRGRGAARELIERLLEREAGEGADLAMLFSEIGPDYYARLGFDVLPLDELTLRVIEDNRRGAPAMMVRAGDDRDIPDIVSMDAARAEPFRLHLARDRDLVKFAIARSRLLAGLGPPGARETQFFVAEEGSSAAAYVVIGVKGGDWTIEGCGDRDPAGARIGGILQVLIAREPARPRPAIKAWLPASLRPQQTQVLNAAPARDIMMVRPLGPSGRPARPLAAEDILYWRQDAF